MKKESFIIPILFLFVSAGFLSSCSSDEDVWENEYYRYKEIDGVTYSINMDTNDEMTAMVTEAVDKPVIKILSQVKINGKKYTVTTIGEEAFAGSSLEEITLPEGLKDIGKGAFKNCKSLNFPKLPESLETIGLEAFYGCKPTLSLKIPESLNVIGGGAFSNSGVQLVYVSSLEKWLGMYVGSIVIHRLDSYFSAAFFNDYELFIDDKPAGDIRVPDGITMINAGAFYGTRITGFEAGEGFLEVGIWALNGCSELESISLPSTTETVSCTFLGCSKLRSLRIASIEPPHNEGVFGDHIWDDQYLDSDVAENCTLYVPNESVEAYRNNWFWGEFKNIVGF